MTKIEKDEVSGAETTGHEWDGIKELNKPAPRWWLLVFVLAIIWAIGYWQFYPTWPTPSGNTKGSLAWSGNKELKKDEEQAVAAQQKYIDKMKTSSLEQIKNDADLYQFAVAGGAAAFKQNCTACHGSGAAGGKGYPNLNDDDWLWGGKLDDIYHTLKVGIRSGNKGERNSQMPAFGRDGLLTREQISDVTEYVMELHKGDKAVKNEAYKKGEIIYKNNCASCHGEGGIGGKTVGAPRHSDDIWLYGSDRAAIVNVINNAPAGVMPAWENRLDDATIKQLSIYVHQLGGGE
jgi:cytochrome c oxidase cbb3-type subunit III